MDVNVEVLDAHGNITRVIETTTDNPLLGYATRDLGPVVQALNAELQRRDTVLNVALSVVKETMACALDAMQVEDEDDEPSLDDELRLAREALARAEPALTRSLAQEVERAEQCLDRLR